MTFTQLRTLLSYSSIALFISFLSVLLAINTLDFQFSDVSRYIDYLNNADTVVGLWEGKPPDFSIYTLRRLGVTLFLCLLYSFNSFIQLFAEYGVALASGILLTFLVVWRLLLDRRYFAISPLLTPLFLSFSYTSLRVSLSISVLIALTLLFDSSSKNLAKFLGIFPLLLHIGSLFLMVFLQPLRLPILSSIRSYYFRLISFVSSPRLKHYSFALITWFSLLTFSASYLRSNTDLGDRGASFSLLGLLFYLVLFLLTSRSRVHLSLSSYFLVLLLLYPFWRQTQQLLLVSFPFWSPSRSTNTTIHLCDFLFFVFCFYSLIQNIS